MLKRIRKRIIVFALTLLIRLIFYPEGIFGASLVKIAAALPGVTMEVE